MKGHNFLKESSHFLIMLNKRKNVLPTVDEIINLAYFTEDVIQKEGIEMYIKKLIEEAHAIK